MLLLHSKTKVSNATIVVQGHPFESDGRQCLALPTCMCLRFGGHRDKGWSVRTVSILSIDVTHWSHVSVLGCGPGQKPMNHTQYNVTQPYGHCEQNGFELDIRVSQYLYIGMAHMCHWSRSANTTCPMCKFKHGTARTWSSKQAGLNDQNVCIWDWL